MAPVQSVFTLAGSTTITFNNGNFGSGSTDDLYWIQAIHGLDGPTLRTPIDDVPFGDGGLIHKFWKGPRRVSFEGFLIAQSVPSGGTACANVLDGLAADLNTCLNSIIQSTGTLSWDGLNLSVVYEVPLDIQEAADYRMRSFTFGLVSAQADPAP